MTDDGPLVWAPRAVAELRAGEVSPPSISRGPGERANMSGGLWRGKHLRELATRFEQTHGALTRSDGKLDLARADEAQ